MTVLLKRFLSDTRGVTTIEYALIAIMVSIAIIAGASSIGTRLSGLYFGSLIANFQ